MNSDQKSRDSEFDLRARVELAMACEPGDPPAHLFRHTPALARRGVRRGLGALLLLCAATTGFLAVRPPELVRDAIEHEYYERTLRGHFMDAAPLLRHLGLATANTIPGYPQLMRPCDIDGRLVYHLTTFFEKAGMVTVLAFDSPVQLKDSAGWWGNVYWEIVKSRDGKPLILVAQKKAALTAALAAFAKPAT
jgi:hypothetical protein